MYTMREVCKETGMTYEGLKFYCNQGLVPNVKRARTTDASLTSTPCAG